MGFTGPLELAPPSIGPPGLYRSSLSDACFTGRRFEVDPVRAVIPRVPVASFLFLEGVGGHWSDGVGKVTVAAGVAVAVVGVAAVAAVAVAIVAIVAVGAVAVVADPAPVRGGWPTVGPGAFGIYWPVHSATNFSCPTHGTMAFLSLPKGCARRAAHLFRGRRSIKRIGGY